MKKVPQEITVLKIVSRKKEQKIYDIMREGLKKCIVDASRYLRWLAEKKYVVGERVEGKIYKQWSITQRGEEYLAEFKKQK